MVSSPLLEDYTISLLNEEKVPTFIPKDPISRYNFVIEAYNNECNIIDNKKLELMKNCSLYKSIYSLMNNFFGEVVLIIIMIFVPVINLITFFLILWSFIYYCKFLELYKKNEQIIPDPFKNMVYSPEMCESIRKISWFFELEFQGLFSLILNKFFVFSLCYQCLLYLWPGCRVGHCCSGCPCRQQRAQRCHSFLRGQYRRG